MGGPRDDEPVHTATLGQRPSAGPPLDDKFGRYRLEHYRSEQATLDADAAADGVVVVVVRDARDGVDWQVLPAHVH